MLSIKTMFVFAAVAGIAGATGYLAQPKSQPAPVVEEAQPATRPMVEEPAPVPAKPVVVKKGPSVYVCQERVNNCKIRCKNSARGYSGASEQIYTCSQACIQRGCNNR